MIALRDQTSRIAARLTTARYLMSPDIGRNDVLFKRVQYERFGVREYWVLDIADGRNRAFQWLLRRGEIVGGPLESAMIRSRVVGVFQ